MPRYPSNAIMMWCRVFLLFMALILAHCSSISRPLKFIIAPITGNSPAMDLMGVAAQLQVRGHSVAVIVVPGALDFVKSAASRHSSNTTAEAIQYITLDMGIGAREQSAGSDNPQQQHRQQKAQERRSVTKSRFAVPSTTWRSMTIGVDLLTIIQDVLAEPCSKILTDTAVMQQIRAFQADAILAIGLSISGGSASDSCGCLLSHALGVPFIDTDGGGLWTGPLSTPQFGTGLAPADLRTARGYTINLITWILRQAMPLLSHFKPNSWKSVRDRLHLPRAASDCPLVNVLERVRRHEVKTCEPMMGVILGSWLLEYPRPLNANQVIVGPGTPRRAHAVTEPQDVADFLNGAEAGLVLVAFGTSYQFNSWLSPEDFNQLAKGFAALAPVRVLWNLNSQGLPNDLQLADLPIGSNTKIVPWVDYNDVLGHPHTRAIVSHCGLHSVYEAAYHGVPVVAVPFMFEQAETCNKLVERGGAVINHQAPAYRGSNSSVQYTSQHIHELVSQVLQDPSYALAAKAMSAALQTYAQRRHPYERAADEIELALLSRDVHRRRSGSERQQGHGARADGGHSQATDEL